MTVQIRYLLSSLLVLSCLASPCMAEGNDESGVTIGSRPGAPTVAQTCAGGEKASQIDCLNKELKQQVDNVRTVGNEAPMGVYSSASSIGAPTSPNAAAAMGIQQILFQRLVQAFQRH